MPASLTKIRLRQSSAITVFALLAGCAVGPDYEKPAVDAPAQWSEATPTEAIWQPAVPDDAAPRGAWWEVFGDARLNALQQQAQLGNQNLQAALAQLEQARALTRTARAGLLPTIGIEGDRTRVRTSANRPASGNDNTVRSTLRNDHTLQLVADYELDFVGRVRRELEAGKADQQQAAADLENVRLLIAADVAMAYFNLRALRGELAILEESIAVQDHLLDVVQARYEDGVANGIDLSQQQLLVSANRSQHEQVAQQYAEQRHALATLLGVSSEQLQLQEPDAALADRTPPVPSVLPGDLLQRRPDIAGAERAVAAANARIGIARAAWFPRFSISAADGFESGSFNTLFDAPSAIWSVGVTLSQTVFDAGRTSSREALAVTVHREATANYRQAVLSAWQEVEDHLSGSVRLQAAHQAAKNASAASARVAEITEDRYQAGLASAVERYTAQQTALDSRRQEQQLAGRQWTNAVMLIKALGGDWTATDLAQQ